MEFECKYHTDHNNRIKKLEGDCGDLDNRLTELDKSTAVTNQRVIDALENLSKLPETMNEISTTMVSMQGEITKSNTRMESLENNVSILGSQVAKANEKIDEVDDEGRFNIRKWIKDNFIALILIIGVCGYLLKQLF